MEAEQKKPIVITNESHQALTSVSGTLQVITGRRIKLWGVLSEMILAHTSEEWVKLIADKDVFAER